MLLLRYFSTLLLSSQQIGNYEVFWGYLNFPSFILATAVFVFAKNVDWHKILRTPRAEHALSKLSGCGFGVYLMHSLVLFWLLDWGGAPGDRLRVAVRIALRGVPRLRGAGDGMQARPGAAPYRAIG